MTSTDQARRGHRRVRVPWRVRRVVRRTRRWFQVRADLAAEVDGLAGQLDATRQEIARIARPEHDARLAMLQGGGASSGDGHGGRPAPGPDAPFMAASTPVAADIEHPRFRALAALIGESPRYHRKLWEWVFILHHLEIHGMLEPGRRGLGFGVGTERLPAALAMLGIDVVATDGAAAEWDAGNQRSTSIDQLLDPSIAPDAVVRRHVQHRVCDMNDIDAERAGLTGFDFHWSACAFEHLGSIQRGLDFVVDAVETTLRPGGVGVHTTELKLSPGERTIDTGGTVLFRPSDLAELIDRLRERGHEVDDLVVGQGDSVLDVHVDTPPYTPLHLKLALAAHVTTSVGIVVRRGTRH